MRNIARSRAHAAHAHGTGGFVFWIAAYAAFMLALIAFSGSTPLFSHHMLSWPSFPGIG